MHQQLVVVLLVGLAASAYGLDLSHASKRSTEVEPRIIGFISDLYAQVIYPPLNHVVTSLALLGAQALAGLHENGLPGPKGRTLDLSDAELRGFFDDLWNQGVKPPIEQALSGVSLMLAQLLAGIGSNGVSLPGKRDLTDAEARGFFDDLWNQGVKPPVEQALSGVALMLAQLLAGIGSNGVNLPGKRDLTEAEMRGFTDAFASALADIYGNVFQKPLENALSTSALMLAQLLAGIGANGVSLGKRDLTEAEMRGFTDALGSALTDIYSNVFQKPLENALSTSALMLAQLLAGIGANGVDLSNIFSSAGKRDVYDNSARQAELRGLFDSFADNLVNALQSVWTNVLQGPVQGALSTSALMAAQLLAGLGANGISLPGKRDLAAEGRGSILDGLVDHASGLYTDQLKPAIENALSNAVLHLAGLLANFGSSGVGRR